MRQLLNMLSGLGLVGFALLTTAALSSATVVTSEPAAVVLAQATQVTDDTPASGVVDQGYYCPRLSSTFQRGATDRSANNQVTELQLFLTDYYEISQNIVVGNFGRITQNYVIRLQQEQGLPAYGIVGTLTRAAITRACAGTSTSTSGTSSGTNSWTPATGSQTMQTTSNVNLPTPSVAFSASASSVTEGQAVTLTWNSINTTRCVIQDGWYEENYLPGSGSRTFYPWQTTTYKLWCVNEPGDGKDGPSAERTLTVTVRPTTSTTNPSTTTSCPAYTLPSCSNGSFQFLGYDNNGCSRGYSCQVNTPTTGTTVSSCTFNGQTVASGSSVTAYYAPTASPGSTCLSEQRTCIAGAYLTGGYSYSSCSVAQTPQTTGTTPPTQPVSMPSCTLTPLVSSVGPGEYVTFITNASNAVSMTVASPGGTVVGDGITGGSVSIAYQTTGTKQVTATVGNGLGTATCTSSVTVIPGVSATPQAPTLNPVQCSAGGTSATISWSPVAGVGTIIYPIRFSTSNGVACPSVAGWFSARPGECDYDVNTTTAVIMPVTPNVQYRWWVHAVNATDASNWIWSPASERMFSCPAQ